VLRGFVVVLGVVAVLGGLALAISVPKAWFAGAELVLIGIVIVLGTVFERWRYRKKIAGAAGPWEPTGERFRDPVSGALIDVAYNPQTGEREYRPVN
jgi:hypothetical protein